ncbi:hypothetical protein [Fructobacillus tropaeoli]|uniref:hypothetical protein n=1 Tax=Fructobacillus tropaeoli TaxID=709323 RepID=UPI001941EDD6|nr:hypothetical protein [Fructobacillus tropaeoli]GIC69428.1 hypothetical protein FT12353_00640 [Fructobacillus tropaeoli]
MMNNINSLNFIDEDELSCINGGVVLTDGGGAYFSNATTGSDGGAFGLWDWMTYGR